MSLAAGSILVTLLFPPFVIELNGATFGLGWNFLFNAPKYGNSFRGVVNVPLLLAEWLAIVLMGAIGWFLAGQRKSD